MRSATFVLLLALAAACRPRVEPVALPTSTPAAQTAGVHACWVESRARFGFTASVIVVRHPTGGDVLIDSGNSSNFDAEIEPYHGSTKRWLKVFPAALKPKQPLDAQLTAVDVDPAGLRAIVPTHAHLDHLGGAMDLPPTAVWVDAAEAALIERGRNEVIFEVIPAHAARLADQLEPLKFAAEPYEIFQRHADLFGDGSVVVVPLPGHTPGSVGVFVRLADGRRVFHVGDAVNDRRQITHLRGRTPAMRRTDSDRDAANRIVGLLSALAEHSPDILMLPAHERAAWRDIFDAPTQHCTAPKTRQ